MKSIRGSYYDLLGFVPDYEDSQDRQSIINSDRKLKVLEKELYEEFGNALILDHIQKEATINKRKWVI